MGNNLTEHGRKLAEIRDQKRAQALRDNLKRRKEATQKDDKDAKQSQDRD